MEGGVFQLPTWDATSVSVGLGLEEVAPRWTRSHEYHGDGAMNDAELGQMLWRIVKALERMVEIMEEVQAESEEEK